MSSIRRGRKKPAAGTAGVAVSRQKPSTKELLINVGEQLFGQKGFDGISLREIASEAGQANSNVVQYHFVNKEGLVGAILEDRIARIEQVRCMQLAILEQTSLCTRQLLKVLWMSLMAIKDEHGYHSFCRFMLQYMLSPKLAPHPFSSFYSNPHETIDPAAKELPCGREATHRLINCYPGLPQALLHKRISSLATMFLASVVEHDNKRAAGLKGFDETFDIEPILDMAVVAMSAPLQ